MPRPRASEVLHPVRNLQRAFEEDERRARKRGRPTDGLGTGQREAADLEDLRNILSRLRTNEPNWDLCRVSGFAVRR